MLELRFDVEGADAARYAMSPQIALRVAVRTTDAEAAVHGATVRCQVRVEPQRRSYDAAEEAALRHLFGPPAEWSRALRPLLWADTTVLVPAFKGSTRVDVLVPCTYDLAVASASFLAGLSGGEVPVGLLFSGILLHDGPDGALRVAPIPWTSEARFQLPVQVYRDAIEHYYPGAAGMLVQKDTLRRLEALRVRRGLPTIEHTIASLLEQAGAA